MGKAVERKVEMESSQVIQQKLREIEVLAHTANVPMKEVISLIERQFLLAAIQRNKGNSIGIAADLGINIGTVYRKQKELLGQGR